MDDLAFLKKLAECNDKEQMARCIENHKPMTNGQKIRSMSDEELCEFLMCEPVCDQKTSSGCEDCKKCIMAWLQQPAEEDA